MSDPKVSIIMPAYNQERYIREAIESVINQSYENWELIVVDDGSTDGTHDIVAGIPDARIRWIRQSKKGVCEARNVGMEASVGEYVAFLDADDLFHPDKLKVQVDYLNSHPLAGLVFVSRIEIDQTGAPLNFFSHDGEVTLDSLVLSFPFAPSDLMLRHQWVQRVGGFNNSFVVNEDRDWYIRLFYAGCRCEGITRFLSYRRLDQFKVFRDLRQKMDDMLNALDAAFNDSRLPADVFAVKNQAYLNIHLAWFYQAAIQEDERLAENYLNRALQLTPLHQTAVEEFWEFMLHSSIRDGGDHEQRLKAVHNCVTGVWRQNGEDLARLISRGYLLRGVREALWGRCDKADVYSRLAKPIVLARELSLGSIISDTLMKYGLAFGTERTEDAANRLFDTLQRNFTAREVDSIAGVYLLNQAFEAFRDGRYLRVIQKIFLTLRRKPSLLLNRGVFVIFWKSIFRQAAGSMISMESFLTGILAGGW